MKKQRIILWITLSIVLGAVTECSQNPETAAAIQEGISWIGQALINHAWLIAAFAGGFFVSMFKDQLKHYYKTFIQHLFSKQHG